MINPRKPEDVIQYKRFILFAFDSYYPYGGEDDIEESFDNLEDALSEAMKRNERYLEIFDCDQRKFIWKKE